MTVPYAFGAATSAIPLSQLDSNFNTPITLGNTAIQLGNTVTTLNNMTLANVTISSGNVTITNVTVTTANATTVNTTTLIATTANVTTGNVTSLISGNVTLTGGSITGTPISGSTGSFTTLTTSGTVTLNGGVANGVVYLDGSKVLTTGSALTFDGTTFSGTTNAALAKVAGAVGWVSVGDNNTGAGALRLFGGSTQKGWQIGSNVTVADALEFSQATAGGGTTFTQQMILTSTGLGIGTSSPAYKLDVTTTAATNGGIRVYNSTSGTNNTAGISFSIANGFSSTNQHAAIQAISESSGNTLTSLGFYTSGGSSVGNATERMRLDASGNLGIGTSSPAYKLDVLGSVRLKTGVTGTPVIISTGGDAQGTLRFGSISTEYSINGGADYLALIFKTDGSERARIDSSGNFVAGGSVALATTATDGFLYVPTCAGTPTGTPTAITGMAPIVVNTTNNKLYFYSGGAWRDAGP